MTSLYGLLFGVLAFLNLAAAVAAAIISLVSRSKHPKRAIYAMIGFLLFAASGLLSLVWPLATRSLITAGSGGLGAYQLASLVNSVLHTVLEIGAIAMLVLALFRAEEQSQPGGSQPAQGPQGAPYQQYEQYQQPQQYPPQQQYPAQQPQQQPQQPQHPAQQPYPYQQYPGQGGGQYPGQSY